MVVRQPLVWLVVELQAEPAVPAEQLLYQLLLAVVAEWLWLLSLLYAVVSVFMIAVSHLCLWLIHDACTLLVRV